MNSNTNDQQTRDSDYQIVKNLTQLSALVAFLLFLDDDTALNNVDLACCKVPDPATTCDAKYEWTTISTCSSELTCKVTFKSSISYTTENNPTGTKQIEILEQLGFILSDSVNGLKTNFESKLNSTTIEGLSISHMISVVKSVEKSSEIEMTGCTGKVQQMILTCGIYKIKTQQYRCVNDTFETSGGRISFYSTFLSWSQLIIILSFFLLVK